jgi:hypothetical protein
MKKILSLAFTAAAVAFLSSNGVAGVLTLDPTSPEFTPPEDFTNNMIILNTLDDGGLVHLEGTVTVAPVTDPTAAVTISGTYSADAGDTFSVAYRFSADLNNSTGVDYTIMGTATLLGVPQTFTATGTLNPGLHVYEGTAQIPAPFPVPATGDFSGTISLDLSSITPPVASPNSAAAGTVDLSVQQFDFKLEQTAATFDPPSQQLNISTRVNVGTGDNVLIGGFIVTGTDPKLVVLRGLGPSLLVQGVAGVLEDPVLELHDSSGATIATNDNWMDLSADDQTVLTDFSLAPTEDAESALVMTLDPGEYTVIVRGANDSTGVALVEAYDLDQGTTDSKLANISTRGSVDTGDNVMIGGFIIGGGTSGFSQVIVRGLGPSLEARGVTGVLADPEIQLVDVNGNVLATNDNWMDDPNMQTVIDNGLAPENDSESAIYDVLHPGNYTVILDGVNETAGVGLVESYEIDGP